MRRVASLVPTGKRGQAPKDFGNSRKASGGRLCAERIAEHIGCTPTVAIFVDPCWNVSLVLCIPPLRL